MAKRDHFLRYLGIISRLRNQGDATFEEIMDYLERQAEIRDFNPEISKRTFQRDLDEIASLFNIEIRFDFSRKVYTIDMDDDSSDLANRLLEAFDVLNLCQAADSVDPHVIFERRRPQGTQHFNILLHAIRKRYEIRFTYRKFWDDAPSQRTTEPYALKESRDRWYLVARDVKDQTIKTFGLDRMDGIEVSRKKFMIAGGFDPQEKFQHCFGVLGDEIHPPAEIILEIDALQGKYVKSFPLHESQQILADTPDVLRIKLYLYITRDFIMELLSLGETVKVLAPARLKKELLRIHTTALHK